jgi:hypothetical protein
MVHGGLAGGETRLLHFEMKIYAAKLSAASVWERSCLLASMYDCSIAYVSNPNAVRCSGFCVIIRDNEVKHMFAIPFVVSFRTVQRSHYSAIQTDGRRTVSELPIVQTTGAVDSHQLTV